MIDKRSATMEPAAETNGLDKRIAKAEAIKANILPLQQRLTDLKSDSYLRESRLRDAVRPIADQLAALDKEQAEAIDAGKPPASDLQQRRMVLIEQRAAINMAFEIESAKNDSIISALQHEVSRLAKELCEAGGDPATLRGQQDAGLVRDRGNVPTPIKFVTNLGSDEWNQFKRNGLVEKDSLCPRDGQEIVVPLKLASSFIRRGLAVEIE